MPTFTSGLFIVRILMIKQTQTKMFDFSDVGLNFCSGSKNLFPSVFKKFLAIGYNTQTGTVASISNGQVTLNFGVSHGYVADRVLKVAATGGYSKEVYIDSVTDQTVTFTDSSTSNLSGTITTYIAPLGWSLLYEDSSVQLYKMKNLAEKDVYVRFVFQLNANYVSSVGVCVGMSADITAGTITDENTNTTHATATTPQIGTNHFMFSQYGTDSYNNYTYSQGYSNFGKGLIIGSAYHLVVMCNGAYRMKNDGAFNAILPCTTFYANADILKSQIALLGFNVSNLSNESSHLAASQRIYIGSLEVASQHMIDDSVAYCFMMGYNIALNSYFTSKIDTFNTTACMPIRISEKSTDQHLGFLYGAYTALYGRNNYLNLSSNTVHPLLTSDSDMDNYVAIGAVDAGDSNNSQFSVYFAVPVEEIKLVS